MSTRRNFLFAVGGGTPLLLGMTNKSGSARPILGSGEYVYEAFHDWGELPADIKYGNTHGVCEDSQGHIYIHHTVYATSELSDSMVVFDHKGKFVKSWGKEFKGGAHGLYISREGSSEYLYLCDIKRGLIVKTTLSGEEVFSLGYPLESEAYKPGPDGKRIKWSPTNLAMAPNGDFYVGDGYGSSYILQYNKDGKYIRTFGGLGKEDGQLNCPHGLIVDTRGPEPILMVADRGNHRIQTFTLDGKHIGYISGTNLPCHFNIYKNGVTVVPDLGARVTLMSKSNEVIENLGDDSAADNWKQVRTMGRDAFKPGKFVCPHGACFDHAGNIFVVEWVEIGRVTKLRKV
jgi:sugar lactone lactonase YvrE